MFRNIHSGGVRLLSTSVPRQSFIGKSPVRLMESVELSTEWIPREFSKSFTKGKKTFALEKLITVKGPKGTVSLTVPGFVEVKKDENVVNVSVERPHNKIQRAMWGTTRALIQNHIIGTTEGHLATLKFVGTGYRVSLEESNGSTYVVLKIGLPYTPRLKIPKGLSVSSSNPAVLLIEGINKQQVKLFAAVIREYRKPEPYKGKGIFVDDETIKLKQKKIK
ncbi:ribosomal protein L6 [Metschnikowia bicuspidata var. bicuspidata NRRL YB-4993]|uniref:Ribosomal protein L6 n=1 Tax=Metschnikowia bicuspidata var. bicuspidata NRRL YB-4993 TaxID=869754 RepID=A0A1A0H5R8_9ASCO|nr:ribosomal protein L6 [Metschnikowia bicuspidata var. bicuspidata NRRL YB-4993]OBA19258.1 ribosomal protein L6 [Metschnikowia bicuspidata var. bicuspidata NRRL YB-4993]